MGTYDPLVQLVNYWYKSMRCCTIVIYFLKSSYMGLSEKKIKWVSFGKKFLSFFCKGPPLSKKLIKIFFIQILQFIPQSKALVEFIRNTLFLKIFISISDPKKPINSVKTYFLMSFWTIVFMTFYNKNMGPWHI